VRGGDLPALAQEYVRILAVINVHLLNVAAQKPAELPAVLSIGTCAVLAEDLAPFDGERTACGPPRMVVTRLLARHLDVVVMRSCGCVVFVLVVMWMCVCVEANCASRSCRRWN